MPRRLHQLRTDYLLNKPDYPPKTSGDNRHKIWPPRLWISSALPAKKPYFSPLTTVPGSLWRAGLSKLIPLRITSSISAEPLSVTVYQRQSTPTQ